MDSVILDLKKQVPDIIRALNRREKVVVSYGNKKLALLQPLPEGATGKESVRDNPLFGIWRDREEFADPVAAVRAMRRGRYDAL